MLKTLTSYEDVNHILSLMAEGLDKIFGDQMVGFYLTGSLTYGGFDRESSDIDFLTVLDSPLEENQSIQIKDMHHQINQLYPIWSRRIEGSYIPQHMLSEINPPTQSRTYVNYGKVWDQAPYGHEWLINLYALYEYGIALIGQNPKTLISPINIKLVREASKNYLHQNLVQNIQNPSEFFDSHYQAYAVLSLCRILHGAKNDGIVSKQEAANWTKITYGDPWADLIEAAENWRYGKEMNLLEPLKRFLQFTIDAI
jgi:hypothetical protein